MKLMSDPKWERINLELPLIQKNEQTNFNPPNYCFDCFL